MVVFFTGDSYGLPRVYVGIISKDVSDVNNGLQRITGNIPTFLYIINHSKEKDETLRPVFSCQRVLISIDVGEKEA